MNADDKRDQARRGYVVHGVLAGLPGRWARAGAIGKAGPKGLQGCSDEQEQ
jgi:hypothetical protein